MKSTVTLVVAAALTLAACGDSKEEKATQQACAARSDISQQVDQLKAMTVSTATADEITKSLNAIRAGLSDFKNAQQDLGDQRRQQFQAANQAFSGQLETIATSLGRSLALGEGKTQATAALQQLGAAYEKTLAPLDCS
jgi:hypothetical protein